MKVIRRFLNPSDGQESDAENGVDTGVNNGMAMEGTTRPLPGEEEVLNPSDHLIFAQASDVGNVRRNNQDAAVCFFSTSSSSDNCPDVGVFVVADGMGGHHDGEIASAIAARTVANEIVQHVYLPLLAGQEDRPPVIEAINDSILQANAEVIRQVPEGGTTLTTIVIVGDFAYIGHVGDSRAYLFHNGVPEQLTRDHSYVQRLYELGQLDQDETSSHPQKNVLYRALGQVEMQEVDVLTRRVPPNSTLLICSDGLWGQVDDQTILHMVAEYADPQTLCVELVAAANCNGGIDNVTAIVIRIPG